jgi:TRAP-type transport system small permease protein
MALASRMRAAFDRALQFCGASLIVILLATVTAGIVSRGLNRPFSWTDELSGFLMVWLACFGWMIATRRAAHIRIRFFQDLLPVRANRYVEVSLQAGTVLFGLIVAWHSIHLIRTNSDVEATTLPIATAWMYIPLLPAGLLTAGQAVVDIVALFGASGRTADRPL